MFIVGNNYTSLTARILARQVLALATLHTSHMVLCGVASSSNSTVPASPREKKQHE